MMKNEIVKNIYNCLYDIYITAKNCHWFSKSYSQHLLFDRIADDILDHIDAFIEVTYMNADTFVALPISSSNIAPNLEDQIITLKTQLGLLQDLLAEIQNVFDEPVVNELNAISQDVRVKQNLLSMLNK